MWEAPLKHYAELLASFASVRLTGSRDSKELYDLHVLDSLWSVPLLPPSGKAIDVGSGGGLPGIVWAICRPDLSVTLLDSARKKCRAMEEIVDSLGLDNVTVTWGRCEEHALAMRERYAFAAARALAHAGVLAEYLAPLVETKGRLLAFKGPRGAGELEEVGGKWGLLGLSEPHILHYDSTNRNYSFIIWEKKAPCRPVWPRRTGLALTKGWWL